MKILLLRVRLLELTKVSVYEHRWRYYHEILQPSWGVSCSNNKVFKFLFSTPTMHPRILVENLGFSHLIETVNTECRCGSQTEPLCNYSVIHQYLWRDNHVSCTAPGSVSQKRQDPHFHKVYFLEARDPLNK